MAVVVAVGFAVSYPSEVTDRFKGGTVSDAYADITGELLKRLPAIQRTLQKDLDAFFDGDPAAGADLEPVGFVLFGVL